MSMPVISALDFTGDNMVDETIPEDTPMKNFYHNKTIFITGGTGFLGQIFVEKLLRCRVKIIYVLARPKKNKTPLERIQETFEGVLFSKLKVIDPNYMSRIHLVEGDTYKSDLGISNDHRKEIIDNVEIVLHVAADVRFDKPLQELCFTNVRGTKALISLSEEIRNLIVFAYVSTAFSQYYQQSTEEKFYAPPLDPDEMIRIAEHFDKSKSDELELLTDKLIDPWANTYVFTKSLSEELVRRAVNKFPTVVIRPAIIISTYEDPIPAWSNNVYGTNGLAVVSGLGFAKVCLGKGDSKSEVVCADFVTNGTLAIIWNRANEKCGTTVLSNVDEPKVVYNIVSKDTTSIGRFADELSDLISKFPSTKSLWVPTMTYWNSPLAFCILSILYHFIPAITFDLYFKLTNNKFRLLPMYRKTQDFMIRISYFATKDWRIINNNFKAVMEKMSENDKKSFPCDIYEFRLLEFGYKYMLGLRTYIVKEPLNNYAAARKKLLLLRIAYYAVQVLFYGFLGCLVYLLLHLTGYTFYLRIIYEKVLLLQVLVASYLF